MDKNKVRRRILDSASLSRQNKLFRRCMVPVTKFLNKNIPSKIDDAIGTFAHKDQDKELQKAVWEDVISYLIDPEEYFLYGFPNLTDEQKHKFVGNREKELVCGLLNHQPENHNSWKIFMDKWKTYEIFSAYFHREAIHLTKAEDREEFIRFAGKHGKVIVKASNSSQGRGIFKVDSNPNKQFDYIEKNIIEVGKSAVVEELIFQAPVMAQFNSSSVNTVRIATFLTDGEPVIMFAFMRTGRQGAVVDNGGAGGLLVGVDPLSGVCFTEGCDEAGNRYDAHPDSGVNFIGFQIPEWGKALSLAKELSKVVPNQKYVGWDLAYTDSGWIMVEGNSWSQFVGPQITQRKGMREIVDQTFYKYLNEGEKQ